MEKIIYIADDEINIRNLVKAFLEKEGFCVHAFATGDLLFDAFKNAPCDLVILDVMMPGNSGFIICTKLREISAVPIIMLTAKDTEDDYVSGLALGSDDYFTKPFSPMKLTMRVKAMFRRAAMDAQNNNAPKTAQADEIIFEDIKIMPNMLTAYAQDKMLNLTKTEFKLLAYMIENQGKAIARQELLNTIWGYDSIVETRATDDTVKRLRRKLSEAGSKLSIDTVWGFGFKLGVKKEGV
ncbi:MAG: response regulator transcription factor [Defluviitaleaceae bacterium]|nr:response regulator transcription factor [Defluviitaleaceae bacterium]